MLNKEQEMIASWEGIRAGYEERLKNQQRIIERYDGFRRWVLEYACRQLTVIIGVLEGVGEKVTDGYTRGEIDALAKVLTLLTADVTEKGEQPPGAPEASE